MKLIVTGLARHGKDTVCEMLESKGFTFRSSSDICNETVVFPVLSKLYNYKTLEECYADRVNHRAEWFNLIYAYNMEDKARLGKLIFENYDIYCGLRNMEEFTALKQSGLDIVTIWVDAEARLGKTEDEKSITITREDCDHNINNNGSLQDLENRVDSLVRFLKFLGNWGVYGS